MTASSFEVVVLCGIITPFGTLSPSSGQVIYVLRTRAPLSIATPCDLHVLGAPLTFVLSQDQTLQLNFAPAPRRGAKDLILEIQPPKRLADLTFRQNLEGHFDSSHRNDGLGFVPSGSPL